MDFNRDVIVIGAGQAGLAASYFLHKKGIPHCVLEQDTIGSSWSSQRWDSFKMNTPNWMTWLPGMELPEDIWDQFMTKDGFVDYLKRYVHAFQLPIKEHCKVVRIHDENGRFIITAENGRLQRQWSAKAVIIASGMMNRIRLPKLSERIPPAILQLHASEYKNPDQLPKGSVVVVGAGQSGCQIAEELAVSGRKVYLASSKVPRAPRRYRGKDIMEWIEMMGIHDTTATQLKADPKLGATQPQSSGVGLMGHTVSYQSLHKLGVTVLGSLKDIGNGGLYYLGVSVLGGPNDTENTVMYFAENAKEHICYADAASAAVKKAVDAYLESQSDMISISLKEHDEADIPDEDFHAASDINMLSFDSDGISTVIWATGFGYDFTYMPDTWLDANGTPKHTDGKIKDGVYCLGFPWLRKKKSGLVHGVKEDAEIIVNDLSQIL
ncbi:MULTISPECIES: NAD(P)-binding domain-containing protein [Chryseobacterium]|uniref:Flavoprotein involved in K+ transport n=1 Tax=Chryseobacterium camelliae TaxID=1265445 RepID=A0ABU0TH15_9FLAO|nr:MULTISPECIES: NAD(P)-binding domain-containing protein [Chryseobacterium]MDT3405854.1 putative flavoprotein involved in K+ transport [Pseudacidovorax intermedius]MDQ1096339.1 putative flavoprotein involved in K+ transport [Chryseobacterium camelliae]MDQ1100278.1 putative flavoprotein involved in K+ transport [Chryseobacterium sp. SORGH_AS_1048]MDR6087621.1 putative flavoprotein involved in K+ transport [Chryseobacterium sp. SORGH_AS_0909]MDR6131995.1 putative flavoprotein involved in K+ tra